MAYGYIRRTYGVNPRIGQRIKHFGKSGAIIRPQGDPHYLRVRFDGQRHASNVHPTDQVEYSPPKVALWVAQEPPRAAWDELRGDHFQVDVLDQHGHLVCTVYGQTSHSAWQRAERVERRSPTAR